MYVDLRFSGFNSALRIVDLVRVRKKSENVGKFRSFNVADFDPELMCHVLLLSSDSVRGKTEQDPGCPECSPNFFRWCYRFSSP